jgi:hypothetical protein
MAPRPRLSPGQQLRRLPVGAARPRWLTRGLAHLAVLCLLIVLVGMIRPRLTPHSAGILLLVAAAAVAALAGAAYVTTRRLADLLPLLSGSQAVADAVLLQLRRIGLPLLGFAFFCVWSFVYVGLWAVHPGEAFHGLASHPRFADFFYYAVSTALISPPGDIVAASRGVRSATMIEMLTGFALLATYLSSFVDWQRESTEERVLPQPTER